MKNLNKTFYLFSSVLSMFFGGMIYLLWRPQNLVMFSWCKSIGIGEFVQQMRGAVLCDLPIWLVYSLPQALWCFSGLCCIHAIWGRKRGERFWLSVVLWGSLLIEGMQFLHVISGTFDVVDVGFIVLVYCLFEISIQNFKGEPHEEKN